MIRPEKKLIIVSHEARLHRFTNESCFEAEKIYKNLQKRIGCNYLIYMYENLIRNEKYIYSSNWNWQDLLIGKKLINNCPIFLTAFKFLEKRNLGHIFVPWYLAPPASKAERNVCGLRSEFNIANGFGYGSKGFGIRETLAFGGEVKDKDFYKNFIAYPDIFSNTLKKMRQVVLLKNHENKIIYRITKERQ